VSPKGLLRDVAWTRQALPAWSSSCSRTH
jgi:hypothetical protein